MSSSAARSRFLVPLLLLAGALGLTAWLAGPALRQALTLRLFLRQPAPDSEGLRQWLAGLKNPSSAVQALWQRGQMVHRYAAVRFVESQPDRVAAEVAEPLLVEAARDADSSVRELALAALAARRDPLTIPLAWAQLRDVDPERRRLGLRYLARAADPAQAPRLIALLADPDPLVVGLAAAALRKLTGQDFGLRVRDAIPSAGHAALEPAKAARLAAGVRAWRAWWVEHGKTWRAEHPLPDPPPAIPRPARPLPVTDDFELNDLTGKPVRLSDFRGRAVWLNFWSTWCTACAAEIPLLNQLQARYGDRLVVLGISLDGVMDEHGHVPGHAANAGEAADQGAAPDSVAATRARLRRTVRRRGIRYRVLWDPRNAVGSRFNGGELPTHVLIAPDGRVRRRFIGARALPIFRQMAEELWPENPPATPAAARSAEENRAGQGTRPLPQSTP